ncbi:hypothetical protein JZU46_02085 [bacterium]|jgi:hypothetical protein|nr:hypothetical protein [bacterium]
MIEILGSDAWNREVTVRNGSANKRKDGRNQWLRMLLGGVERKRGTVTMRKAAGEGDASLMKALCWLRNADWDSGGLGSDIPHHRFSVSRYDNLIRGSRSASDP